MSGDAPASAAVPAATGGHRSLEGLHSTVEVPHHQAGFWQQMRAFTGPALLVSVGYMDPGNWGTDLAGGARFQYNLLWVVLLASVMAIFLQVSSPPGSAWSPAKTWPRPAAIGIRAGRAGPIGSSAKWPSVLATWPKCSAARLRSTCCFAFRCFGRCIITACDVFLLLTLQRFGMRTIEAVVLTLVMTIGACFFIEIFVLPADEARLSRHGPRLADARLPAARHGLCGDRHHRRHRDAP